MSNKTKKTDSGIIGKATGFALGKAAKNVKSLLSAMKNLAEGTAAKAFELLKECGVANTLQAAFTGTMPFSTMDTVQVATPGMAHAPTAPPPSLGLGSSGSGRTRRKSSE